MAKQISDFVRYYTSRTQLNSKLVEQVTTDFVEWIKDTMLSGYDVRLAEFGKFKIQPNTYSRSGLMKNGASLHYHEFRPSFRFIANFRKKCEEKAEDIRKGIKEQMEKKRK